MSKAFGSHAGKVGRRTGNYDPWSRLSAAVLSQACLDYNKLIRRSKNQGKEMAKENLQEAKLVERFLADEVNPFVMYLETAKWENHMTTEKLKEVVESVKQDKFNYGNPGRQKLVYE